jgi:LPXTG-site transpeptidase (sortase) family protein
MVTTSGRTSATQRPRRQRRWLYQICGNLLLFGGLYLLLFVGGVYADVEYQRMAARGDSDIEAPRAIIGASGPLSSRLSLDHQTADVPSTGGSAPPAVAQPTVARAASAAPSLSIEEQIASALPAPAQAAHIATVERLILPSVKLDAKVIEVGWQTVEQDGQQLAVWNVAEYAVGQHQGSANPGEGGNIVLAGHVGGYGHIFRDLYYVHPGEPVILYSQGREHRYVVKDRLIVDEDGVSPEQQAANVQLISPTDHELVTMITCWPPTGPKKFTQRVIIRAVPEVTAPPAGEAVAP